MKFVVVVWQEMCQSLCRLIVIAADNNTKQMVRLSVGDDKQRFLVMSLIEMLLVITALLFSLSASYGYLLTGFAILSK